MIYNGLGCRSSASGSLWKSIGQIAISATSGGTRQDHISWRHVEVSVRIAVRPGVSDLHHPPPGGRVFLQNPEPQEEVQWR